MFHRTLWKDADPDIPILKQAKGGVREAALNSLNYEVSRSLPILFPVPPAEAGVRSCPPQRSK
jgi:hypothetical protein